MYDKNIIIRTRVTRQMRDEFKEACEANNISMSDLLRMWITDYVATNKPIDDVATNNKDEKVIDRNKTGQLVATTKIKIIDVATNKIVAIYNRGQPIKKDYVATNDYEIVAT